MDIKPPVQPPRIDTPVQPVNVPPPIPAPLPISDTDTAPKLKQVKRRKKLLIILASFLAVIILIASGVWVWYQIQLSPADKGNQNKVVVEIAPSTSPKAIAATLKEKGVIRNETAFGWYTRLNGSQNKLQAGTYRIAPSETTAQVVEHLVKGSVDSFSLTFYPGATLVDNVTSESKRIDVTSVLLKAGYSKEDIASALAKQYESPLFDGKPTTADLEGYVFGETYQFTTGVTVEDILSRTFEEYYTYVQQEDLVSKFKQRGLTLYQGITLASIVQRESGGDDKAQIAQVFYSRLATDMQLGSDVTYQYIADKTGVARDPLLNSPYNTRVVVGLPPGPIATPGLASLKAVANPAAGDYLYFLSGDNDVTYYGRTLAEHEANIRNHCTNKCQIL